MCDYKVSICIPTYNRLVHLKANLSALLERYCNSRIVEIVVSDNASTDGTGDWLKTLSQKFNNLTCIFKSENTGFDRNLMDCYFTARGKYVHFLGDDDQLLLDSFDDLLGKMDGTTDLIISNYTIKTSQWQRNGLFKPTKSFRALEDLFSYAGHHLTFMSLITLKKQPIEESALKKYVGFYFMHVSIMLEALTRRQVKLLFLSSPIVLATDDIPATYDVGTYFLKYLAKYFEINENNLQMKRLKSFFVSVICYCINSNVKFKYFIESNSIPALAGYSSLFNIRALKAFSIKLIRSSKYRKG